MKLPKHDDPFDRARAAFDAYCAMGEGQLPDDPISAQQVSETRLANGLLTTGDAFRLVSYGLGMLGLPVEDGGVLGHKRRLVARFVRLTVGALMRVCSSARLDFGELCHMNSDTRKRDALHAYALRIEQTLEAHRDSSDATGASYLRGGAEDALQAIADDMRKEKP